MPPWPGGAPREPGVTGTAASPGTALTCPTGCILLLQQAGLRGAGVPGAGDRQQGGRLTRRQAGQGEGLMHHPEVVEGGGQTSWCQVCGCCQSPFAPLNPSSVVRLPQPGGTATSPSLTSPPLPRQIVFVLSSALNPGNEGRYHGVGWRGRWWSKVLLLTPGAALAPCRDGGAPGEAR